MNINQHNYAGFFIDYFDGKLNAQQQKDLLHFLKKHPELKSEFDSFEMVTLEEDSEVEFSNKSSLKRSGLTSSETNHIIAFHEGDLTLEEVSTIKNKINNNSDYKAEWNAIKQTVLSPDFSIQFPFKNRLKKKQGLVISLYNYRYQTIAAVFIVLIAGLLLLNWSGNITDSERTISPAIVETKAEPEKENTNQNKTPNKIIVEVPEHFQDKKTHNPEKAFAHQSIEVEKRSIILAELIYHENLDSKAQTLPSPSLLVVQEFNLSHHRPLEVNRIESIAAIIPKNSGLREVGDLLAIARNNFSDMNSTKSASGSVLNDNLLLSIAATGSESLNKVTGTDWLTIEKQKDSSGHISGYEINTPLFSFSRSRSK